MERDPIADIREQWETNRLRWGAHSPTPAEHLLILTEEVGEIAQAMQKDGAFYGWPPAYNQDVYEEIIDSAAVLLEMAYECQRILRA